MKVPRVTSTKYGLETLPFRGCQIWNTLPSEFKYLSSVPKFKEQIKGWSVIAEYVINFCFRWGWVGVASLMVRFLGVSCYSRQ